MNSDPSKLRQQQQSEQTAEARFQQETQAARHFNSVEELIRFDAAASEPSAEVAERLKKSIALEPKPAVPWWRRLFGRR